MAESILKQYNRHRASAGLLISLAIAVLIIAAGLAWISNFFIALVLGVIALFCGIAGFDHLEQAGQLEPEPEPPTYDVDMLTSALKGGGFITVVFELHYLDTARTPYAHARIKQELLRNVNIYAAKKMTLTNDPIGEIDRVLQKAFQPIRDELNLTNVRLQTIDVKPPGAARTPRQGLYWNERS